jgi:hypothetical protein
LDVRNEEKMISYQQFNKKIPLKKSVGFDINTSRFQSNKTSNMSPISDIQSKESEPYDSSFEESKEIDDKVADSIFDCVTRTTNNPVLPILHPDKVKYNIRKSFKFHEIGQIRDILESKFGLFKKSDLANQRRASLYERPTMLDSIQQK